LSVGVSCDQERGAELWEAVGQRSDVRPVPQDRAGLHAADLDNARQSMRERKEQQRRAARSLEDLRQRADRIAYDGEQVAVRELAALWPAGGA
jgi:hypothetical protein